MLRCMIQSCAPKTSIDSASTVDRTQQLLKNKAYDLYILDGDLNDESTGCDLAEQLWQSDDKAMIVAYTASVSMEEKFKAVFAKHNKNYLAWPKQVTPEIIKKTIMLTKNQSGA
jgi:CheY-like chemotaxis protein